MSSSSSSSSFSCHCFTLGEIEEATNNFDEENVIGHGGEGSVYLANIHLYRKNEKTLVAVKHLKPNSSDQFEKEIQTVSKIHHPNLVSLLGCCQESGQKILVYEYMQKGSLSDYVKKKKIGTTNSLPWKRRLEICIGAARGLQHLHTPTEDLPKGIIHRDIKPENILLDKSWVAKVSDFGLFKLSHAGQTHSAMITGLKGTSGYCAPESLHNQISRKIDVYAFGVVMFEVLCRKSPWDRGEESYFHREEEDLGLWARENVDTEIKEEFSEVSLVAFTDIIGRCLQRDPAKRPTMDDIVLDLESALKCQEPRDELIHPNSHMICAGCNEEIGRGQFRLCMTGDWHPKCFRCHHCDLPIHEFEWSFSENRPFHKSCYEELYRPICDVCKNFTPINADGSSKYRRIHFWGQKVCDSHKGVSSCVGCGRIEPWDTKYLLLEDGRKLCPEGLDSAIMNTNEGQPLYLEIHEFYKKLNMKMEQHTIPFLLVQRRALIKAKKGETNLTVCFQSTESWGLILSEEQTVDIIRRSPKIEADKITDIFTEPFRLICGSKVKAILIIYGHPKILTGAILAHEMMHAWLRLQGYPSLSPNVEEGICYVLEHMWLTSKIKEYSGNSATSTSSTSSQSSAAAPALSSKGTMSSFEKQLGEFRKYTIESNTWPHYDGFIKGKKAVQKYGLQRTLNHIKATGTFPS